MRGTGTQRAGEVGQPSSHLTGPVPPRPGCRTLIGFVHDAEGLLPDPRRLEAVWSRPYGDLTVRCVIG